jgi:hypothetical protein
MEVDIKSRKRLDEARRVAETSSRAFSIDLKPRAGLVLILSLYVINTL